MGSAQSQLYLPAWEHELSFETDLGLVEYIRQGITWGFDIVDEFHQIEGYEQENYSSAGDLGIL